MKGASDRPTANHSEPSTSDVVSLEDLIRVGAEAQLRLQLDATVPWHETLVDHLCEAREPPLELAITLEDTGQRYMRMSEILNSALEKRGLLGREPEDPEKLFQDSIANFVSKAVARIGVLSFHDGTQIDGREAFSASPMVTGILRSAMLIARKRSLPRRSS